MGVYKNQAVSHGQILSHRSPFPLYPGDRIHTPIEVLVPYCDTDPVYCLGCESVGVSVRYYCWQPMY
jgi:hypothetical protein